LHLPGLPASDKKLTGAGDCLMGATLASICEGLNIIQAISVAIAAAKAAVKADSNVPLTFDLIGVAGMNILSIKTAGIYAFLDILSIWFDSTSFVVLISIISVE